MRFAIYLMMIGFSVHQAQAQAQGKPGVCEEQLVFPLDKITPLHASPHGFVVLAPIGSPLSLHSMKRILREDSVAKGFQKSFSLDLLEDLIKEDQHTPREFRVAQLRPLTTGQIQLALYQGRVIKYKRISRNYARLTLSHEKQRVEIEIQMTDEFYVRYLPQL